MQAASDITAPVLISILWFLFQMLSVPAATSAMSYSICSVQHRTYVVEIRAEAMFFASPVMYLLLLPAPLTHRIH